MNEVQENRLLAGWTRFLPRRSPAQVGAIHESDCELVALGRGRLLAITTDAVDEEVELGLYPDATVAARMAVVATLSDLAAVGATPLGLVTSVCLPRDRPAAALAELAAGIASAADAAGTFVLGGDTSEGAALRIACTGVGIVPAESVLRRVGLLPGDHLFATGPLGAGAALAAVRLVGLCPRAVGVDAAAFHPPCRLAEGDALRGIASACIDTSDGLVAALDQLARINEVAIDVEADPESLLAPSARAARALAGASALTVLSTMHGEFELVFGVPAAHLEELAAVAARLDWRPVAIGRVRAGRGLTVEGVRLDGARVRNAWAEANGDLPRYLRTLEEAVSKTTRGVDLTPAEKGAVDEESANCRAARALHVTRAR